MNELPFSAAEIFSYLLVFTRLAAFTALFPLFRINGVPRLVKGGFAALVAFLVYFTVPEPAAPPDNVWQVTGLLVGEAVAGLILGYLVAAFFSLFLMVGQFIDLKAGLMLSGVFEPQFGSQVTFLGQFYFYLSLVFYLAVNGHHYLLKGLADSFILMPPGTPLLRPEAAQEIGRLVTGLPVAAFQICAPVMVVLFVVDMGLGLLARTVPQMHVFIEGLPLKIALALLLVLYLLPAMGRVFEYLLDDFVKNVYLIMRGWR